MIEIKGLDHIVLRTSDLAAMLYFYQEVLGCSVERHLEKLGLTQLRAGSALIDIVTLDSELGRLGGEAPTQNGRNIDHFCLQIAPMSETQLHQHLSQYHIKHGEFTERYGAQGFGRSIYLHDPEGNVVELKPAKLSKTKDDYDLL